MARRGRHYARRKPVLRPAAAATGVVALGAVAVATTDMAGAQSVGAATLRLSPQAATGQLELAPAVRDTPADVQRAIADRAQSSTSRSAQRTGYAQRAAALRAQARSAAALKRLQTSVSANELREAPAQQPTAAKSHSKQGATSTASTGRTAKAANPAPVFSGDPRSIAQSMLASYGWGQGQFGCLNNLWTKESSWQVGATNPSSGAYGIPQSLPAGKMASAGADWRTNPATQIRWGLSYIQASYGSPCGAWAHSVATNWY